MCEVCSNAGNDPQAAADMLFTDIAKAKNSDVYFESDSDNDLMIILAAVDDGEDKHGHYVGFKRKSTDEVVIMINFDCASYHRYLESANQFDMLSDANLMNEIERMFQAGLGNPN